ncbi:MAG TPA: PspA/IM30 family protein [Spirochaetota bacterium]|nr:PspA/IM30 family protein [Spirochaetota bacterium]HOM38834.1 PspA/IM30 family protein [Spirochaetota bacterium]HPQ49892.1 PspA/IM30 family protein [Spirochaetota bacterium]
MGLFQRMAQVLKANLNDLISKAEDPKKMLEQIIIDMQEQLAEAKKEVAKAIADEKRLYAQVQEQKELAQKWEQRATLAVQKGDDNLAMEALKRKKEAESLASEYEAQWTKQKEVADKLKIGIQDLQNKIEEASRKKNLLVARQKRAEAQKTIQNTMSKLTDTSAFDSFARMEEKVKQIEAEAEAEEELNKSLSGTNLDDKFKELEKGGSPEVADELAALKAKLGK